MSFWDRFCPYDLGSDIRHRILVLLSGVSLMFIFWGSLVAYQIVDALDPHGYISSRPALYLSFEACLTSFVVFAGSGFLFYILQAFGSTGSMRPVWVVVLIAVCCFVLRALLVVLLCACPMLTQSPSQEAMHDNQNYDPSTQLTIRQFCSQVSPSACAQL